MADQKRPLLQGDEFANSGLPQPPIDKDGKAHLPQEFRFGIPMGAPKPCGAMWIEAARWNREYFDRPSLVVPDTDDPVMHIYFFECNAFQNYNWTSWQKYKARDCRRGGVIYIHRPGWYTFQNVGTEAGAIDIKCRVYDQASLWNWTAEMSQITGYDPSTVAWKTIAATRCSLPGLHASIAGGAVLESPTSNVHAAVSVTDTGATLLAANATRISAIFVNRSTSDIVDLFYGAVGTFGTGIPLKEGGVIGFQIDGFNPWAGLVTGITNTGKTADVSVLEQSW